MDESIITIKKEGIQGGSLQEDMVQDATPFEDRPAFAAAPYIKEKSNELFENETMTKDLEVNNVAEKKEELVVQVQDV